MQSPLYKRVLSRLDFTRAWRWKQYAEREMREMQSRLVMRENFTIISQNCAGGVMYHLLGIPFDSPTINLFIIQPDFCKFCSDLEYYVKQDLRFYMNESDTHCPYAYLGHGDKTISIQFTHYSSESEAREKWESRKKRIHWDNIYIVANDGNKVSQEALSLLDTAQCKRKIVFTAQPRPEIKNSFHLKSLARYPDATYSQLVRDFWTGYRSWEQEFDLVAWLNGERSFRLK